MRQFLNSMSAKAISTLTILILCFCPRQVNATELDLPATFAQSVSEGIHLLGFEGRRLEDRQPVYRQLRSAVLRAVTLPGDYNNDHIVDSADYLVWRHTLGDSIKCGEGADGDWNGVIELADYDIWHSNFGITTSPINAIDVPLSAALQLTFCFAALFYSNASYRRRRTK